jgi:hypothetical protein
MRHLGPESEVSRRCTTPNLKFTHVRPTRQGTNHVDDSRLSVGSLLILLKTLLFDLSFLLTYAFVYLEFILIFVMMINFQ